MSKWMYRCIKLMMDILMDRYMVGWMDDGWMESILKPPKCSVCGKNVYHALCLDWDSRMN